MQATRFLTYFLALTELSSLNTLADPLDLDLDPGLAGGSLRNFKAWKVKARS